MCSNTILVKQQSNRDTSSSTIQFSQLVYNGSTANLGEIDCIVDVWFDEETSQWLSEVNCMSTVDPIVNIPPDMVMEFWQDNE